MLQRSRDLIAAESFNLCHYSPLNPGLQRSRDLIAAESGPRCEPDGILAEGLQRSRDLIAAESYREAIGLNIVRSASTEPRPDRRGKSSSMMASMTEAMPLQRSRDLIAAESSG